MSALQVNWTQEPHLVPKHNLRRVMISSIEFESQSARYLNLAAPKICTQEPPDVRGRNIGPGLGFTPPQIWYGKAPSFSGLVVVVVVVVVIACPRTLYTTIRRV